MNAGWEGIAAERGAGAGAAAVAALAAGLVARSARGAVGTWDEAGGAAAQAERLRRRLASLADENAAAYAAALAALDPETGEGEGRDDRIATTLTHAATVPAEIAESSGDLAELACAVAAECGADLRPDAHAATLFAEAAARAAVGLVEANLLAPANSEALQRAGGAAARAAAALERAEVGPRG